MSPAMWSICLVQNFSCTFGTLLQQIYRIYTECILAMGFDRSNNILILCDLWCNTYAEHLIQ